MAKDRSNDSPAAGEVMSAAEKSSAGTPLLTSMTGKVSPAKAAVGDRPVFDYIASLPEPQRSIAQAIDELAARTLPGLERSVKWGMAYRGVGAGWWMGKATRGVELETLQELDEGQLEPWMSQVTAAPGVGGKRRWRTARRKDRIEPAIL